MEFDIGNILYIVITLVAVIIGLMGKKKKPAGQGSGEGARQSAPGFLENLEKAFNMGNEEQGIVDLKEYEEDLPMEEEVMEEPSPMVSETVSMMEEYLRMTERRQENVKIDSMGNRAENVTAPLEIIDLDPHEGNDYTEMVQDFDAAKAVIYASIINRIDY